MAEHTELPWNAERVSRFDEYDVCGKNGEQVAACYVTDGADEPQPIPAPANAAFIVKACNSHEALVKALEVLLDEAESFSVSGVYFDEECMGHKGPALARAALLAAREVRP